MTQENREGKWASPERQQDLKYQKTMQDYFAPKSTGANGGRLRGPLRDDTAVIDRPEPGHDGGFSDNAAGANSGTKETIIPGKAGLNLRQILLYGLAALAILVVLVLTWWLFFGRGGAETSPSQESQAPQAPQEAPVAASAGVAEPTETNLTFEAEDGEGDAYSIRMGEYEWEGTKGMNGDVDEVVLEGRTAAHFTTAVRLSDGEITTGVFGRAEPDKPLWHATYQRTTTDGRQSTTGTYQVIDQKRVILEGAYTDRVVEDSPGNELDLIQRTYVEGNPDEGGENAERFDVLFEASEGAEVPWLPGNPVAEGESNSEGNGEGNGE